jgi:hypothetical protein
MPYVADLLSRVLSTTYNVNGTKKSPREYGEPPHEIPLKKFEEVAVKNAVHRPISVPNKYLANINIEKTVKLASTGIKYLNIEKTSKPAIVLVIYIKR